MKPEARILVSRCVEAPTGTICVGIVFRGPKGIDDVEAASECKSLCGRLSSRGFTGELRYAIGDCTCGLPEPPASSASWERAVHALEELPFWVGLLKDP